MTHDKQWQSDANAPMHGTRAPENVKFNTLREIEADFVKLPRTREMGWHRVWAVRVRGASRSLSGSSREMTFGK